MARIRSIKPEFPQSETIGRLSRDARLLFILLWTHVDDSGRARAASRMLASLLYPYDDDAPRLIDGWLAELEAEGCVRRYEVDGTRYLDIPNWLKHQKIDKPSGSKFPPFDEGSRIVAKPREESTTDLGSRILDLGSRNSEATASAPVARPAAVEIDVVDEDPKARLFRIGKTILVSFGVAEKRTGALIGQWLKVRPDPSGLLAAIQFSRDQNVADPVAYISAAIAKNGKPNGKSKPDLAAIAFELADEFRERERAQGAERAHGDV